MQHSSRSLDGKGRGPQDANTSLGLSALSLWALPLLLAGVACAAPASPTVVGGEGGAEAQGAGGAASGSGSATSTSSAPGGNGAVASGAGGSSASTGASGSGTSTGSVSSGGGSASAFVATPGTQAAVDRTAPCLASEVGSFRYAPEDGTVAQACLPNYLVWAPVVCGGPKLPCTCDASQCLSGEAAKEVSDSFCICLNRCSDQADGATCGVNPVRRCIPVDDTSGAQVFVCGSP